MGQRGEEVVKNDCRVVRENNGRTRHDDDLGFTCREVIGQAHDYFVVLPDGNIRLIGRHGLDLSNESEAFLAVWRRDVNRRETTGRPRFMDLDRESRGRPKGLGCEVRTSFLRKPMMDATYSLLTIGPSETMSAPPFSCMSESCFPPIVRWIGIRLGLLQESCQAT
jgi:hypothetical protein